MNKNIEKLWGISTIVLFVGTVYTSEAYPYLLSFGLIRVGIVLSSFSGGLYVMYVSLNAKKEEV